MRHFTLLIIAFTLLMSTGLQAGTQLNPFTPLELLGVEYSVEESPYVEGIGETHAVYRPYEDDIIISERESDETFIVYFHTVLHELVHWTGFRENRCWRAHYLDTFQEEIVAEYTAFFLSEVICGGEYEYDIGRVEWYLNKHPKFRKLSRHEEHEVNYCIRIAYKFLLFNLKRLDKENELGLK